MNDIPQEWIKKYVNSLLEVAKSMAAGSAMQNALILRAEYAMDLVQAFRNAAPEPHCECHERDGSYVCEYCRSQGLRGHMEKNT